MKMALPEVRRCCMDELCNRVSAQTQALSAQLTRRIAGNRRERLCGCRCYCNPSVPCARILKAVSRLAVKAILRVMRRVAAK